MGFGVEPGYKVEAPLPSSVILGEDLTPIQFPLLQREADNTYPTMKWDRVSSSMSCDS